MNFHPKSITMKWMQSNESADEDAVRLLDNLFESNKSPQFWSLLQFYINFRINAAKTPCKHSSNCRYGKTCCFNHGTEPFASPNRQFCHNPYLPAPTFSQRYHITPTSVHSSTQTSNPKQKESTGISSAHSKHALGSTDHTSYIFPSKQPTGEKQKSGALQATSDAPDINESESRHTESEVSEGSDDSWQSIRRRKREFNSSSHKSPANKPGICKECNSMFQLTEDEAAWFSKQGLYRPVRCLPCRQARRLRAQQSSTTKTSPPTILQSKNVSHRPTEPNASYASILCNDRDRSENPLTIHSKSQLSRRKAAKLQTDNPALAQLADNTAQSSHTTGFDEGNDPEFNALPEVRIYNDKSDQESLAAHDESDYIEEHSSDTHTSHADSGEEHSSLQVSEENAPEENSADESLSLQSREEDKDTHSSEETDSESLSDALPHLQSSSTLSTSPPQVTLSDFQLKDPSLLKQLERTLQSAEEYVDVFQASWDWTTTTFAPVRHPYSADMANLLVRTFKYRLGKHLDKLQQERTQGPE